MDPHDQSSQHAWAQTHHTLSSEEIQRAEQESRELQEIWNRMETAERDPHTAQRDPLQLLFTGGTAALCALLAFMLMTGKSGAPGALTIGTIILIGGLWLLSNPDWRTPALTGLTGLLLFSGAVSLMFGLLVTKQELPPGEFVTLYNENREATTEAIAEFQEGLLRIAASQIENDVIMRDLQRPIAPPQPPATPAPAAPKRPEPDQR